MANKKQLFTNSIRIRLPLLSILAFFPLICFLITMNFYSIQKTKSQTPALMRNTTDLYIHQIDSTLRQTEKTLGNFSYYYEEIQSFALPASHNHSFLAQQRLQNRMQEEILIQNSIDSFFIFAPSSNRFISSVAIGINYDERYSLESLIKDWLGGPENNRVLNMREWLPFAANNHSYLLRLLKIGEVYLGAWANVDSMLAYNVDSPLQMIDNLILVTRDGTPLAQDIPEFQSQFRLNHALEDFYYYRDEHTRYLITASEASAGPFLLVSMLRNNSMWDSLDTTQILFIVLSFTSIFIVPLLIYYYKRKVIKPLIIIVNAIRELAKGNFNAVIPETKELDEFQIVNTSFNTMSKDLKQLTIDVYEHKLLKQQAELQYRQLQIQPHFFVNALNSVFMFIETGHTDQAKQMLQYLVQHLRYALRKDTLVRLGEELQLIENYLKIQRVRYSNRFISVIQIDPIFHNVAVPPLILQTFMENAFKYAVSDHKPIVFAIECQVCTVDPDKPMLQIDIFDNGKGFPEHVLTALQDKIELDVGHGEKIGISNICNRLIHLYNDQAEIEFNNLKTGGAHIRIRIPMQTLS